MSDSGYFVGQVADLLGSCKKKNKSEKASSSNIKLAELFNVKQGKDSLAAAKSKSPKQSLKEKKQKFANSDLQDSKPLQKSKKKKQKHNKVVEQVEIAVEAKKNVKQKTEQKKTDKKDNKELDESKKRKKKKKQNKENGKKTSNEENEFEQDADQSEKKKGFCPPKGIVHESLVQKPAKETKSGKRKRDEDSEDENDETKTKRRKRHKRDKTKDKRTVFVGNLPIDCKKSAVKTLFAEFGKIESLRYRCPPVSDPKVSKKVTMIKKDFHPDRSNIVSFICFEEPEAATKALKLNGHSLNGFHLRVDLASNEKKHNKANSVFVGNLPYDIEENEVWKHFEPCGFVENVRIVRDRKTGLGKGFGYVLFEDKTSCDLALKLNSSRLKQRNIRVDKCVDSKKIKTPKNHPARQRLVKKAKKLGLKPTNLRPGEKRKPRTFKKEKKKSFTKDNVAKAFTTPKPMPSSGKHIKFD